MFKSNRTIRARSHTSLRIEQTRVAMQGRWHPLAGHRGVASALPLAPQAPLQLQTRLSHQCRR